MGNESETCNGTWRWRQVFSYNYKLHEDFPELAKGSQKLFRFPAIDICRLTGRHFGDGRPAGRRTKPVPGGRAPACLVGSGEPDSATVLDRTRSSMVLANGEPSADLLQLRRRRHLWPWRHGVTHASIQQDRANSSRRCASPRKHRCTGHGAESTGAELYVQPTRPRSERAEQKAQATFAATWRVPSGSMRKNIARGAAGTHRRQADRTTVMIA